VPAEQLVHDGAPTEAEYEPDGHFVQLVEPIENMPTAHAAQLVEVAPYWPGGHGATVQLDAPVA